MKIIYSVLLILLYAMVVFSVTNYAQGNKAIKESVVKRAFEVFPVSLESDIPGIVESTIHNIILLKKYHPAGNYAAIIEKLNKIAEMSSEPSIRFKAHLASMYISFSNIIDVEPAEDKSDRELIFKQISTQLGNKLAVSN